MRYDISIIGGGTAGWLAAAFLSFHNPDKKICLVESPDIPTIGVGEGTFPTTMYLLNTLGIKPSDLIVKANGGLKVGIQYNEFAEEPFWLSVENAADWERFGSDMVKNVALMNKSPIVDDSDYFAMHFVASDLAKLLQEYSLERGVTHISANVTDSVVADNHCSSITLDNNTTITSDWFVDCSGFARILISKTDTTFTSYSDELLVDSAVVGQTQYKNPEREFNPFTKITARPAGWVFRIPTYTRIGNGYVYSSKHTTPEAAQAVLQERIGPTTFKHLRMQLGYYDKLMAGNIVAVGLSGGFIEPMEATAIHLTERTLIAFDEILKGTRTQDGLNEFMHNKIRYIKTLILGHYAFSKRTEPFWQEAQQAARNSAEITEFLASLKNGQYPTADDDLDVAYPYCQWNDLLRGFGEQHYYPEINTTSRKDIYMATYYLPNHYQYITQLRNQNE